MKTLPKILILILCFSCLFYGQKRRTSVKKNQQVKKIEIVKFQNDWEKIPRNFVGNNFEEIYYYLLRNKPKTRKDEFETTAEYEQRIADKTKVSLGNGLTAQDSLIFVYHPGDFATYGLRTQYDADKEILSVEIKTRKHSAYLLSKELVVFGTEVKPYKFEKEGTYIGQNAYGTKVNVTKYLWHNFYLGFANIEDFEGYSGNLFPRIKTELPMSVEKAKQVKPNISALYITNLINPYMSIGGEDLQKPTVSKPEETKVYDLYLIGELKGIWIFDKTTGEVLSKIQPK
jgi:hypothetical protein